MRTHAVTSSRRARARNRGSVLLLFALSIVALLMVMGLAVDAGVAYVASSNLSKAVDAAALAAARHTGLGDAGMKDLVQTVAETNLKSATAGGLPGTFDVVLAQPAVDTTAVRVTGQVDVPTVFFNVAGRRTIHISRDAEATRFPLDMSLVLDLSLSLDRNGAFTPMQDAAKAFVDAFSDQTDRIGLVTFSTVAKQELALHKNFKTDTKQAIGALNAIADTNMEEGLHFAKSQMDAAVPRAEASKIVVLFTDGRPTAFNDAFRIQGGSGLTRICHHNGTSFSTLDLDASGVQTHIDHGDHIGNCTADGGGDNTAIPGTCTSGNKQPWYEGTIASYISGSSWRGLFRSSDGKRVTGFTNPDCVPTLADVLSSSSSPNVQQMPDGSAVTGDNIRRIATKQTEDWASQIRAAGYTIYVIGLGNPAATAPGDTPDPDLLRRIANEDGVVDGSQPKGAMLFAPSTAELNSVFTKLADRVLTRLTR
jgi:Flp pilus assembly protein TadG